MPLIARFWAARRDSVISARIMGAPAVCGLPATRLTHAEGLAHSHRRAVKSFEPMLTGIAWTPRRFYLVVAATAPGHEHVGRLIHCAALFRADPDYAEHHGKRISLILLANNIAPALADFARRQRVRILIAPVSSAMSDASARQSADA